MAMDVKIEGIDEIRSWLQGMSNQVNPQAEQFLDRLASLAKAHMANEAPKFTGLLSSEIDIVSSPLRREIIPVAKNLSGKPYAGAIETGSYPKGVPNVYNIMQTYGSDIKTAWAIAYAIQKNQHPANPFVERTYKNLLSEMDSMTGDFADKVVITHG